MTEITNYSIDIIERTIEILIKFYPKFTENDREATFLMNCLLGIIVALTEREKKDRKSFNGKIDPEFIKMIPDKIGFISHEKFINVNLTRQDLTQFKVEVGHKNDLIGKDVLWFISKIRNSIAHQNIHGINEEGKWVGVSLFNMYKRQKDFEIIFSIEELRDFSTFLAKKFIDSRSKN